MLPESLSTFAVQVAPSLASLLVTSLWQGMALVLLTACTLRLLPSLSAALRCVLWTGVLVLAALLPLERLTQPAATVAGQEAIWHARSILSTLLIIVWLFAAAVRLAQLVASSIYLHRVLRRAETLSLPASVTALLNGRRNSVRVCTSPDVDRPSVAGFLRPCILLPPGLPGAVSEAELHHILLHEREHLNRQDHWVNLLGQVSLVLFPLSPALIWVNRRLALERELACDDGVLQTTGARKTYAACLARVAESSLTHGGLALAIGMLGVRRRSPDLVRRVDRILAPPVRSAGRLQTRLAMGALCAGILGSAALLAHSPELVSFTPAAGQAVTARWIPPSMPGGRTPTMGQTGPVLDRVSISGQSLPATMVKAVLPQSAPLRTNRRLLLHSRSPKAVLTSWHVDRNAKWRAVQVDQPAWPAAATPRTVPLLLRVSSPDPGANPAWYTAIRTPEGWLVVMI